MMPLQFWRRWKMLQVFPVSFASQTGGAYFRSTQREDGETSVEKVSEGNKFEAFGKLIMFRIRYDAN